MRTVRKTWISHGMPHKERISYETALKELENVFTKYSRKQIKEKLDQGTTLSNGTGTFYRILVVKNNKKKGGKTMKKEKRNPAGKRTIWIDEKLHTKLKVLASKKGMKMGIFVEGLINQALNKRGE